MKKNNIFIFILPFFYSCSINKIAVKHTSQIINNGLNAIFSEKDTQYVKEALPSNLKLMEILMQTEETKDLLLDSSIGFCGYSWAFLEDENKERASYFYQKGINYSNKALEKEGILKKDSFNFKKLNKENSKFLFWNIFCKSALLNINLDNPDIVSSLGEIKEGINALIKINDTYLNNSIYAIDGSINASLPKMFGGDLLKAENNFKDSIKEYGKDFLLNYYMYAKTYSVSKQDEELFDNLINKIENTEISNDNNSFFNQIAKEKAKKLKEKKNDFF